MGAVFGSDPAVLGRMLGWAGRRIEEGPDPAAGAWPMDRLDAAMGGSVTPEGLGWDRAFALFEEVLAAGLDILLGLRESFGCSLLGFLPGGRTDLVGFLSGLGNPLLTVRLGFRDDLVGPRFGLLDLFQNVWSRHTH